MKALIFVLTLISFQANSQHINALGLFNEINEYRKSLGLPALRYDSTLQAGADEWAKYIVTDFNHTEEDVFETLAMSYDTETLLQLWKESPPHNEIILGIASAAVSIYKHSDEEYYAVLRSKEKSSR